MNKLSKKIIYFQEHSHFKSIICASDSYINILDYKRPIFIFFPNTLFPIEK